MVRDRSGTDDEDAHSLPSIETIGVGIEASESESTAGDLKIDQGDDIVHEDSEEGEQEVVSKPRALADIDDDEDDIDHTNVIGRTDIEDSSLLSELPAQRRDGKSVDGTTVMLGTTTSGGSGSNERAPLTKKEIDLVKKACPTEWLCKGIDYMTSIDSTELVSRVVRLWSRIQEHTGWAIMIPVASGRHGTPTDHTLPFTHRPLIYSPWMKAHRIPKIRPSLKFDVDTFIPQFRRWWSSLQPAWRRTDVTWPLRRDDALSKDWHVIARGGPNGLYLVTLGLAWQVAFTAKGDTSRQMVQEHIDDVEWAYERILDTLTKLPPPLADSEANSEKPIRQPKRGRDSDSKASVRCEQCGCSGACKRRRK